MITILSDRLNIEDLISIIVTETHISECDKKTPNRFNRKQLLELIAYIRAMQNTMSSINEKLESI